MAAAITSHRIDAAYTVEPFYTAGLGDTRLLARASTGVANRYMATGWIATESWLASHADVALRFGAAIHRTAIWANAHHKESAAILEKVLKVDPATADKMYRAPYALALETSLIQPSIDTAAKYTGQAIVPANSLIWAPAK
jgi:ABC-type nitrate/sulfonate/bicarbonate transport system substrate-binding protein